MCRYLHTSSDVDVCRYVYMYEMSVSNYIHTRIFKSISGLEMGRKIDGLVVYLVVCLVV